MPSLADLPELIGFFSYSREDDQGSRGGLSDLRDAIQVELSAQLGRSQTDFRIWQDKAAISLGMLWENEIQQGIRQSVFFIPIITPRALRSHHCGLEFQSFLAREAELGRADLVFPILYIPVPALEDEKLWRDDPVLSVVGTRQYLDWRELRHHEVHTTDVGKAVEQFCRHIRNALNKPWLSPEERAAQEKAAALQRAEDDRKRREAEERRQEEEKEEEARKRAAAVRERERADEARRQREQEAEQRRSEEQRLRDEANAKRLAAAEQRRSEKEERRRRRELQARPLWPPSRPALVAGSVACLLLFGAIGVWLAERRESPAEPTPVSSERAPAPVAAAPAPVAPAPPASAMPAPAPTAPSPAQVATATPLEKGAQVARRCAICHSLDRDGPLKVGPGLYGVVGRPIASVPGFHYSAALKARGGDWTLGELLSYLTPATADNRHSVPDSDQRADLIAFLATLR